MHAAGRYDFEADLFFGDGVAVEAKNAVFLSGSSVPVRLRPEPPPNPELIADGRRVVLVEAEPARPETTRIRGFFGDHNVIELRGVASPDVVPAMHKVLSRLALEATPSLSR